jgi:hypothetical protein
VLHDGHSRVLGDRKEKRLANVQHNTSHRRVGKASPRNIHCLDIEVGVLHEKMAYPKRGWRLRSKVLFCRLHD